GRLQSHRPDRDPQPRRRRDLRLCRANASAAAAMTARQLGSHHHPTLRTVPDDLVDVIHGDPLRSLRKRKNPPAISGPVSVTGTRTLVGEAGVAPSLRAGSLPPTNRALKRAARKVDIGRTVFEEPGKWSAVQSVRYSAAAFASQPNSLSTQPSGLS